MSESYIPTNKGLWPREREDGTKPWLHGDLRNIGYSFLYGLFDKFVEEGAFDK